MTAIGERTAHVIRNRGVALVACHCDFIEFQAGLTEGIRAARMHHIETGHEAYVGMTTYRVGSPHPWASCTAPVKAVENLPGGTRSVEVECGTSLYDWNRNGLCDEHQAAEARR